MAYAIGSHIGRQSVHLHSTAHRLHASSETTEAVIDEQLIKNNIKFRITRKLTGETRFRAADWLQTGQKRPHKRVHRPQRGRKWNAKEAQRERRRKRKGSTKGAAKEAAKEAQRERKESSEGNAKGASICSPAAWRASRPNREAPLLPKGRPDTIRTVHTGPHAGVITGPSRRYTPRESHPYTPPR